MVLNMVLLFLENLKWNYLVGRWYEFEMRISQ